MTYSHYGEKRSINDIGADFFEFLLKRDPLYASSIGQKRFNHLLADISQKALLEQEKIYQAFKAELSSIDSQTIDAKDLIAYDFLRHEIDSTLNIQSCKLPLWVVDQQSGPQIALAELSSGQVINNYQDLDNLITRYQKAGAYLFEHIINLKTGLKLGLTSPAINISHVIAQLDQQLKLAPEQSSYQVDLADLPESWSQEQKNTAHKSLKMAITKHVYPGLLAYRDFLRLELLPQARKEQQVGLKYLELGPTCYQNMIERHTGTKLSASQIHALGLAEVSRIKDSMLKLVIENTTFTDVDSYIRALKADPNQYLADGQALVRYNQELLARAQAAITKAFNKLPSTKIEVKALEAFREQYAPVAYYFEAPAGNDKPAYYYLNTYQSELRPLYNMAALAFHEALPGHHIQISLANENTSIPLFQRHIGQTAFVEGWALYAEILARELGLYHTTAEQFGSLNYELWRALRLVVDTGIHDLGWSRQEAIDYLFNNSALTKDEVVNEIDRYIIWPAQALAYKIGQLEFQDLRSTAEMALKEHFSLSDFHDQVLSQGAMPLSSLRTATVSWLEDKIQWTKN